MWLSTCSLFISRSGKDFTLNISSRVSLLISNLSNGCLSFMMPLHSVSRSPYSVLDTPLIQTKQHPPLTFFFLKGKKKLPLNQRHIQYTVQVSTNAGLLGISKEMKWIQVIHLCCDWAINITVCPGLIIK